MVAPNRKFQGLKNNLKKAYNKYIAEALMREGKRLVDLGATEATFTDRTGNLRNSYGCCLYYNGEEYGRFAERGGNLFMDELPTAVNEERCRYYFRGPEILKPHKDNGEDIYGDEALTRYFDAYKAPKGKWQLVIVAAMWYGRIVESHDYKVISWIGQEMEMSDVRIALKGSVQNLPEMDSLF